MTEQWQELKETVIEMRDNGGTGTQAEIESHEIEKINCKTTKCENCINHNDCDYEPQERS